MFNSAIFSSEILSSCLDQRAKAVAVRGNQHALAGTHHRRDRAFPVGKDARDGIFQRFRQRQACRIDRSVARIAMRRAFVIDLSAVPEESRNCGARSAPGLRRDARRFPSCSGPAMRRSDARSDSHVLWIGNPHPVDFFERQPQCLDGALENGREGEIERVAFAREASGRRRALPRCPVESGTSVQPVKRFSWFHVLWPWRSRTSVFMRNQVTT